MADLSFGQQAGLAGISSVMDFAGSSILANSANAKSKRAAERQLWQNVYLMNLQNEYNKPINQMRRLEEAGLNPNLVYGSGADTLSATAGRVEQSGITPSKGAINFIEKMSMLNAMKQQEANIDRTNADTGAINTNIDISKAELDLRRAETSARIRYIDEQTRVLREESGLSPLFRAIIKGNRAVNDSYNNNGADSQTSTGSGLSGLLNRLLTFKINRR